MAPGFFPKWIEDEHLARYRWASRVVRGRAVLDVASGTGYGSAELVAAGARSVASIERNAAALAFARTTYRAPRYVRADAQVLPLRAGAVDVVVSLETIEHLDDPARFLAEVRRVLRRDGILVLSSPNPERTDGTNPYHVHEMPLEELTGLLRSSGFRLTGVWGQYWRMTARRGIWWLPGLGRLAFSMSRRPLVWALPGRFGFRPFYWCLRAVAAGAP